MAVDARHLNLFPSQILSNREMMMMNSLEGIGNVYGTPMVAPSSETLVPMYSSPLNDSFPVKNASIKSDSGLTYAVPVSRKRPRDSINPMGVPSLVPMGVQNQIPNNRCGSNFTFLGEDMSFHFQQQQLEIDCFIAQHTEKVRLEIEERRKRYSRRIAAAVEENITKKLKARDEEMEKIGKLNWALEERVKSLCVENQIWKDVAQSNEATANALRCNLEQILQAQDEEQRHDAESCCGNGNSEEMDMKRKRMCRRCGKEESCVLLLPCRHLCLCTICGSFLHTCPVCNSTKTASLHVNLSS